MITSRAVPAPLPARIGVSQTPRSQPVRTLPTPANYLSINPGELRGVRHLLTSSRVSPRPTRRSGRSKRCWSACSGIERASNGRRMTAE